MIDSFALALSHGLILLAVWRLAARPDLDEEDGVPSGPWRRNPSSAARKDRGGA